MLLKLRNQLILQKITYYLLLESLIKYELQIIDLFNNFKLINTICIHLFNYSFCSNRVESKELYYLIIVITKGPNLLGQKIHHDYELENSRKSDYI